MQAPASVKSAIFVCDLYLTRSSNFCKFFISSFDALGWKSDSFLGPEQASDFGNERKKLRWRRFSHPRSLPSLRSYHHHNGVSVSRLPICSSLFLCARIFVRVYRQQGQVSYNWRKRYEIRSWAVCVACGRCQPAINGRIWRSSNNWLSATAENMLGAYSIGLSRYIYITHTRARAVHCSSCVLEHRTLLVRFRCFTGNTEYSSPVFLICVRYSEVC